MNSPIRLGIISFAHGHIHAYFDVINGFDDAEIVAAWDNDHERGQNYCDQYGIAFEADLDTLLMRDDIEAVFITSPTNQHAAHAVAAAQAGKHILLQKPMALTLEDCDTIIDYLDPVAESLSGYLLRNSLYNARAFFSSTLSSVSFGAFSAVAKPASISAGK